LDGQWGPVSLKKGMSNLKLVVFPNSVLSRKTEVVKEITPELVQVAKDMIEKMYLVPGIGLAANQIGVSLQLAVIDTRKRLADGKFQTDKMTEMEKKLPFPLIMFNPEILSFSGESHAEEGCLSVPGYFDAVQRSAFVRFRYLDENGQTQEFEVDGLTATCVQHEVDHLNGRLFLDRLTPIRRSMIKNKIKKNGYPKEYNESV